MTFDDYEELLDRFADELAAADGAWEAYMPTLFASSVEANECVDLRRAVLTEQDIAAYRGYLEIGYFDDPDEQRRLAWWAFSFEIIARYERRELERSCSRYRRDHPLFVGSPKMFDHIRRRTDGGEPDLELVSDRSVQAVDESEVYRLDRGFGRLHPSLDATIPAWARNNYPEAPIYIRLDPSRYSADEPLRLLQEAAIVPANPHWLETLALFADSSTYAQYELLGDLHLEGMEAFRDFMIRKVRRLEIRAGRREADYLSMIVEELPESDASNGLMIGRCIHLDTRAPIGTRMQDAVLQHLDLAINVYVDDDRALRLTNTLQHGKSQSATFRTHLLRIESVPFPVLFVLAEMFFLSKSLVREWLADVLPPDAA